ncbi:malto-oligosyltrehalose synthase [Bosea sp. BK604]|uniref:malto-oligosyltrehalose synthase n=1 Tax=Bosea sp. BK604 TaxID=2512180 RepID=UPI00104A08A4|nr:malto-oligosyltrehalose synthase [Bosea sp. BK604]TCR68276.1 maltooligosyl trehalose synthase [Bosea sp. BK604]
MHDKLIETIAELAGIAKQYRDSSGNLVAASLETKRAVLSALGYDTATVSQAQDALARLQTRQRTLLAPIVVAAEGRPTRISMRNSSPPRNVEFVATDETGGICQGRIDCEVAQGGAAFQLPALPLGYWTLSVSFDGQERGRCRIICAPDRCHEPGSIRRGERGWGVTSQLYSLRSDNNFGMGDYGDAAALSERAGRLGASFLGLSPVHALFVSDPEKASPYSPSSRLMLDPQYLNPSNIDGFEERRDDLWPGHARAHVTSLRESGLVDRRASWEAKRSLLQAIWRSFDQLGPNETFASFRSRGGQPLVAHATFEALSELFAESGARWLGDWPQAYRDAGGEAVARFAGEHPGLVDFHIWLQWQADQQLGAAQAAAIGAGMDIGLFRDLAVGVDGAGSEVWSAPQRFMTSLSIGAPPDPIGPAGQNWGLPPFHPLMLEDEGLEPFRAVLAANMRHAGAIRIDHAFQLQRLFLIPAGASASDGAYISYPFKALLALLRLESYRARCMVIAEDLGTGPDGFSDAIMAAGVYSYRVLPFERDEHGAFKTPQDYPERALAALTTHDLPTFKGWWKGLDIDLRHASGQHTGADADRARAARINDREKLVDAMREQQLLDPAGQFPVEPPIEAAVAYLARSRSALVAIQTEDAAGELNQANLPGMDAQHPNWQRKLSLDVVSLTATRSSLAKLAALFANEGRSGEPRPGTALAAPPPRATYRLQFHRDFTFEQAAAIVPYLARLGISHVYASPIQTARPGSLHGYDIVDHTGINPELGGMTGFLQLSDALRAHEMGLVLDIVPNHMGIGGADNNWWLSVLEWGQHSPHAAAFDIDWERLGANGKLVVPFLGERYGEALENGRLELKLDANEGTLSVWHGDHRFPINPLTYPIILDRALLLAGEFTKPGFREALAISSRLRTIADAGPPASNAHDAAEHLKLRFAAAVSSSVELAEALHRTIVLVNGSPGIPESFETLHRILEAQAYRLAYWRVAASDINYRRFFEVNSLAGIRVEDPDVFERTHRTVIDLVRQDRIQGLRVDHVDGLADPAAYLRALQAEVGPGFYILVEKILGPGEELPPWPISGTTGYDVLNLIDGVLVDQDAAENLEEIYREVSGATESYAEMLREVRRETLETGFASELEVLVSDLVRVAHADRHTRDYTVYAMRKALAEIIERFPVYRSYVASEAPSPADRRLIRSTIAAACEATALPEQTLHEFIAEILLAELPAAAEGSALAEHCERFRRRFQQLTGPVMAKSLEDTLFYRYGVLLALNEVGAEPEHFGISAEDFHAANGDRCRKWPHAMIATATHDTKRGEDSRARLLALSDIPAQWGHYAASWQTLSRQLAPDSTAPDGLDRYLVLQQLLAAWPLELLTGSDPEGLARFAERMDAWVEKALRESKRNSSWTNPREQYEAAVKALVAGALKPESAVFAELNTWAAELAERGVIKGLARTALKLTLPGVPDIYQGTEMWDFSLVDPDNRRPVDYVGREKSLSIEPSIEDLMTTWQDGRIKQRVITRLLEDRRTHALLYEQGHYQPVSASGERSRDLIAFERRFGGERLVVVVARTPAGGSTLPAGGVWGDTMVELPVGTWRDVIAGTEIQVAEQGCSACDLFRALPIAVMRSF